ncbi:MAG: MBL fold metallo-hydrolase [Actinomycetota bacterium]|nr:MBL fold metallo-hydrolase [Actinomycetota bacterium]
MSLAVTVLGSSAMFATVERAAAGYLLEVEGRRIWLDAGPGTWRNLLRLTDYRDLDGVILTHAHPDHTTDVFGCYHALAFGGPEPFPAIPLWAPVQVLERLCAFAEHVDLAFDLRPLVAGGRFSIGQAQVMLFGMAHPVDTVGVRVECNGSTFAYTADTGNDGDLVPLTKGAGLLLSEATLQDCDGRVFDGHMSAAQSASLAREAGVPRLVLTHLPPGRDLGVSLAEARAAAPDVHVVLAADGERYEV